MRYIYRLNLKKSATLSISGKDYLKNVLVSSSLFEKISFCHYAIFICKRGLSVCLSVCLFGYRAQTTGGISTKFCMGHSLVYVGNLKILLWVDLSKRRYSFGKPQKSRLSPYGPGQRVESFCGTFCSFFGGGIWILFNGPSKVRPGNSLGPNFWNDINQIWHGPPPGPFG